MIDYSKWTDHDLVCEAFKISAAIGSASVYVSAYMDERKQARQIADELLVRLEELRRLEQIMRDQRAAAVNEYIR